MAEIRSEHKAVYELQPPHQLDSDRFFGLLGVHQWLTDGFDGRKYAGKWLVEVLQLVFGALSVWQHAIILKPQRWVRAAGLGRRRRLFSEGRRGAPQGGAYSLPH